MKRIPNLLAMTLLLAVVAWACSNVSVDEYREPIQNLSSEYDETGEAVMAFSDSLRQGQLDLQATVNEMQLTTDQKRALSDAQKERYDTVRQKITEKIETYRDLQQNLRSFVEEWNQQGNTLNTLKSGLQQGDLPSETPEQVGELKQVVSEAKTKLDDWKSTYESNKQSVKELNEEVKTMMSDLTS